MMKMVNDSNGKASSNSKTSTKNGNKNTNTDNANKSDVKNPDKTDDNHRNNNNNKFKQFNQNKYDNKKLQPNNNNNANNNNTVKINNNLSTADVIKEHPNNMVTQLNFNENLKCKKCNNQIAPNDGKKFSFFAPIIFSNKPFNGYVDKRFSYNKKFTGNNNNNNKTMKSFNYNNSKKLNTNSNNNNKNYSNNKNVKYNNNNNNNNNNNGNNNNNSITNIETKKNSNDSNVGTDINNQPIIIRNHIKIPSSSTIERVRVNLNEMTIFKKLGEKNSSYPIMQCGTLEVPNSYHNQRSTRMDVFQIDDGFHSDGGTETPPPSPSSGSSIASTSDHGSLESVDTGSAQRLAVLSFEQCRKLNDVMNETVAIHGRGNFPTLEVTLKDLVTIVRKKLETDVQNGGAGMLVKDIRLNGGAASHVLANEDQQYNDLDLIFAIEFSSTRHFDRVKTAVLNSLLDLLPDGVSRRRIMPCALKEAYVGKMVKVNNNNDGDRWSLISLGNSPGHKNVELKFVDTMRRQFEFSVDSFQIVLDSLLLFYDCAALPISENFYPTVVGESVYGDFQEALYHLQKKMISTRQPEEIRGGGLLKYCNLLVRNYKPVDNEKIKQLERYMCSRFFIDFPDITTQTVKLEAYLRNHFWGVDEEPLQYQYLMHLREVVETSTVCLMGHERRQTLLLIQSLAMQILCREQQKQQQQHQAQQMQHQIEHIQLQSVPTSNNHQTAQIMTTAVQVQSSQQHNSQNTYTTASTTPNSQTTVVTQQQPQTIQIQAGPPGLLYANGVYYAPVIPTTICTCNSTWIST